MTIYFISGLGADKRAFEKLRLPDKYSIKYIDWLKPESNENLESYAKRLSEKIDISVPFVLTGLSFGGIVAIEIAKHVKPILIILISSLSSVDQAPGYFRLFGKLHLDKIVPVSFLTIPNRATYWIFGAKKEDTRKLLSDILKDTDKHFLKWAIRKIITWKNRSKPDNIFHIHGTNDHVLPIRYVSPDIRIPGGGHLMVYDCADEISRVISERLCI